MRCPDAGLVFWRFRSNFPNNVRAIEWGAQHFSQSPRVDPVDQACLLSGRLVLSLVRPPGEGSVRSSNLPGGRDRSDIDAMWLVAGAGHMRAT